MQNLKGKITIFKTLALSKVIFLAHVMTFSTETISAIVKIQKDFLWNYGLPKIKHDFICNCYENESLKMLILNLNKKCNVYGFKSCLIIAIIASRMEANSSVFD